MLKIKSATDRRLVHRYQKNNRSISWVGAVIFLHLQYLFHKILTYLRYSINRLQYKTEQILKEI